MNYSRSPYEIFHIMLILRITGSRVSIQRKIKASEKSDFSDTQKL